MFASDTGHVSFAKRCVFALETAGRVAVVYKYIYTETPCPC